MPILLLEFCHYLQSSLSTRLQLQSRSTCECCSPFVQLPSSHATVSKRTPSSFSPQFSPSTSVLFLLFSKVGKGGIGYNGLPTSRLQATYGKLYCRSTTHRRSSRSPQALVLPLALVLPDHIKLTLSTITLSSSVRAINIDIRYQPRQSAVKNKETDSFSCF